MDALNVVYLSYKPRSSCVGVRPWQYTDESSEDQTTSFFFFFPLLGYSTPNSIWDCQNADEFIVPSHLALFTLSCGVKPLHEEEKYIPSLIGCSAL